MARIRTVKPEFWTSEQVMECSPIARLLFIGLWNFCDDSGRHPYNIKTIKALIFPSDNINSENVRGMLDELETHHLIQPYEVEGKKYFQVTGWKHQKIDKPQKPKFPAPFVECSSNYSRKVSTELITHNSEHIEVSKRQNGIGLVKAKGWTPAPHQSISKDRKRIYIVDGTDEWKAYADDFRAANRCEPVPNQHGGKWFKHLGEAT